MPISFSTCTMITVRCDSSYDRIHRIRAANAVASASTAVRLAGLMISIASPLLRRTRWKRFVSRFTQLGA